MPARPTWKGYLKISLVNIPVKVFPATDAAATLSFNQLHAECQTRIQQKRWCPHCEKEVPNTDIVKGFEFEKGRYVVVNEEDIEKVRVESTRVINLEKFTDDTEIDPIYLERPYYLAPDGPVAREAFSVIREGMAGKAGIGKVALYGREYLVKVQPREKGLIMYTLRHAAEIRSMDAIDELADMPSTVKLFASVLWPAILNCPVAVAPVVGAITTPGVSCSRVLKLRPLSGKFSTNRRSITVLTDADSVLTSGAPP